MRRSKDEAKSDLGHLLGAFYEGLISGIGAYYGPNTQYASTAHLHRKTTRRSVVFDHASHELASRLEGAQGVTIKRGRETARYLVNGRWIVSVHKADRTLRTVLNKTRQSRLFESNELHLQPALDATLEEDESLFPAMTSLFLVYVPDGDLANPDIYLLCPKRRGVDWEMRLHKGEGGGAVIEFPPSGLGGDDEPFVKLPDDAEKKKEKGDPE